MWCIFLEYGVPRFVFVSSWPFLGIRYALFFPDRNFSAEVLLSRSFNNEKMQILFLILVSTILCWEKIKWQGTLLKCHEKSCVLN
jgi:hypothetical protein